ncbi:chondroitin sulfate ABC exolyase-like isoform X2 [Pocillopora verrucosa]|uniref:chondroitin sulfate ABC exolyase-like isoform X2 n=1 Tax=Pocillopora verrucosa TaxID=203993 RepID=UPI00333F13B4
MREYTFEAASDIDAFSVPATSALAQSSVRYKDGSHSMKWTWASGDTMTHTFSPAISGRELRRGGIQLWLYNNNPRAGESLAVSFQNTASTTVTVSQFNIKLNFKGWRAVWVSYQEAIVTKNKDINVMKITAPTTQATIHPLYFDLLRFASEVRRQSRDKVVPPIDPNLYSNNNFWQQTYRWSQVSPPTISVTTPSQEKLDNMTLIEKRLENWYVKQSQSSLQFPTNAQRRWMSLQMQVDSAYTQYEQLNIVKSSEGVITGVPLYADKSKVTGGKKFGEVVEKVLLPLALDYHVRSRDVDVNALAADQLSNLNGTMDQKNDAIKKIAGGNQNIQAIFTTALGTTQTSYTLAEVKVAIGTLNTKRKERLLLLLEYIEDQGWNDGSGIGTLDHEMNNSGAGFMNAVFLLRKEITAAGKIDDYVATMKWYNEFGEVYQDPFEYAGTTADRMRTIAVFRLFTVLMMPTTADAKKLDKIRDMEELVLWYANALSPNEGFAGVLKPDYLGFHHNSYYASAYTPHAIHCGALIEFLLSGTPFKLSEDTSKHIKKGLETMRIVAVKYSTPNSVCGRFPGFYRAILAKNFPAYAYAGATAPSLNADGSLGEIAALDSDKIKMFLRLNDAGNEDVSDYLEDGTIFTSIYYLNTIGSINIMEEISSKAASMSVAAESSPQGFWTKNYASLVIARRENWAVTMKGFNKYVWDFEASSNQNVYGLYQSHGALLVANSEASLKTLDIDNGWDWTRHPGTTTIKMDLEQMVSQQRRYFQPRELAGGLTLIGGGDYATGGFGMDFSQPSYKFPAGSFQLDITFGFKKSVFFADFAVICLGSGITTTMSSPNITQTTLFQTKLLNASNPSSILINETSHSLNTDLTKAPSFFGTGNHAATLMDVNGNTYYIPDAHNQGLNVKIGLQNSRNQRGSKATSARYATAWLNHGVNPTDKGYEYTILVNRPSEEVRTLAENQASGSYWYQVLQRDNRAHVVKINNCPRQGETQYGYVFFDKSVRTSGPVRRVTKDPCIVMVEEVDTQNLYIAVSYPNLNFNISRTLDWGSQVNGQERFYSVSTPVEIEKVP